MVIDADKDVNDNPDNPTEESEATAEESKSFGKKQILLFIVLPFLVLLAVGGGLYFAGFFGGHEEEMMNEELSMDEKSTGIFYDLPDVIVNLNTSGRKPRFLKVSISMELGQQTDVPEIEKRMPRILDHFQTYLRELREEDLRGSTGIYRLRLELLARVNAAVSPISVRDILFREILVQ